MNELAAPATILVVAALIGWIVGRLRPPLMRPFKGGEIRARRHDLVPDRGITIQPELVKAALHDLFLTETPRLDRPEHLAVLSPLVAGRVDLRTLFVDVVADVAVSKYPRDAESGRLLVDYYVKRVGTHEVVMERLHLSRPTFYRRLRRGLILVAERLDGLNSDSPASKKRNLRWGQLVGLRGHSPSMPVRDADAPIEGQARGHPRGLSFTFLRKVGYET
ncbi:MAG TPA: hypothetical protein VHM88_20215 [Candidatus Acidoferrales bacterium]|jgi:hypothetical protein|nr:hypothetical protein [Candidatus Acidoferrales bacterium]